MKKVSTSFLKLAVILIGIPVLAVCIFVVPLIAGFAVELVPDLSLIKYVVFIDMYGAAIPFYFALYQAFNLLRYIDKNTAFSELSVKALKNIKLCAIAISGLYVLGLPIFSSLKVDPPIGLVGLVIIFASLIIAVFAAVLQRLLQEVIDIKSENDLTV